MATTAFIRATAERAAKTFVQALGAYATTAGVFDVFAFDWRAALGVSLSATVYSVITSLASTGVGGPGPSLGQESLAVRQDGLA